jgi:hypothetical protein
VIPKASPILRSSERLLTAGFGSSATGNEEFTDRLHPD